MYFGCMKSTSVRVVGVGACLIVFALFLFFARRAKYQDFRKNAINGTIDTIYRYRDYVMFYVNKNEYRIIPQSVNLVRRFDDIAKRGDTIYKAPGQDTIKLTHHGSRYLYTVQKW